MHTDTRKRLLVFAFAITAAGAFAGATIGAQTKEQSLDETCAHEAWPNLPVQCIQGADGRAFRTIAIDQPGAPESLADRFAVAFE
jgi:hypothetical protein